MNDTDWIKFNPKEVLILFIYYITFLLISLIAFLFALYHTFNTDQLSENILNGFLLITLGSLLGSLLYYIRKLYKVCIQKKVLEYDSKTDFIQKIGAY